MSTVSLRLPVSLHDSLRDLARRDGVSLNQFIITAVAEKLSALETEEYLAGRAARGSREGFERALSKVADNEAMEEDGI